MSWPLTRVARLDGRAGSFPLPGWSLRLGRTPSTVRYVFLGMNDGGLVPADAVMIFQSGIVHQPDYVATMLERTISHYELRNMRGFMPAPETVILIYEATRAGSFRGKSFPPGSVIESTTWVLRDGSWGAVLNQETPIAGEK